MGSTLSSYEIETAEGSAVDECLVAGFAVSLPLSLRLSINYRLCTLDAAGRAEVKNGKGG